MSLVESSNIEFHDLKGWLVREIKNYYFIKKQMEKKGCHWFDGKINFFRNGEIIPIGLWKEIKELCKKHNYECKIKGIKNVVDFDFDEDFFRDWVYEFFTNKEKKPYEWQIDACVKILKYKRSVSEIATGGGKTLIMYTVLAFLKSQGICNKFMIIVPNVNLVGQSIDDFYEYNNDAKLNIKFKEQLFFGDNTKEVKKGTDLLIGTFHSLIKLDKDIFKTINCVVVDECHYAKANTVKDICAKLVNCHYRIGLSGTTMAMGKDADSYTIQSHLGPLCQEVKIRDLIDGEYLSDVQIKQIYLKHLSDKEKKQLAIVKKQLEPSKMLALEKKLANTSEKRLNFLLKLVKNLKGTTLLLFHDIAGKYGKRVYEMLKDILEIDVYYIDGNVKQSARGAIYEEGRSDVDKVLICSYGTTSTGINIPNINNVVLSESFKSPTIVLQSIGRGTRLAEGKEGLVVYDLVDDFRSKGHINFLYRHGRERCDLYIQKELKYEEKRIEL
jgi:superfamily II DNA or RNA helicase